MSEKEQRDYCHAVGLIGKKFIYVSPFNSPITMSLDTAEECFKEEFDFLYAYNTERNYIGKKTGTKCNGVFQIIYPYGLPSPNIKATDFKEMFLDGLKRNNRDIKKSLESIVKFLDKGCRESETLYNIGEGECHFSLTSTPDMEEHSRNIEETVFGIYSNRDEERKQKEKEKTKQGKLEEEIEKSFINKNFSRKDKKKEYCYALTLTKKGSFYTFPNETLPIPMEIAEEYFRDHMRSLSSYLENYASKKRKLIGISAIIFPCGSPSKNIGKDIDLKKLLKDNFKYNGGWSEQGMKESLRNIVKFFDEKTRKVEKLYNSNLLLLIDTKNTSLVEKFEPASQINRGESEKEKKYKEKVRKFKEYQNKLEEKIEKCSNNLKIKKATKEDPEKAAYLFLAELKKKKLFNIYKDLLHPSNIEEVIEMFKDYKRELIEEGERTKRG